MDFLYSCGVACFVLSVWAVVQLSIMGVLYKIEAVPLYDDVETHGLWSLPEVVSLTRENYHATARNCWIAAIVYLVMILISYLCIIKANRNAKQLASQEDEDIFCEKLVDPPPPKKSKGILKRAKSNKTK